MKIKLSDVVNNIESLKNLQNLNLPVRVSYKIKRLVDRLNPILKTYDEKRTELVNEFGEKDDKGDVSVKDPEKLKLFLEKFNELISVEEEVEFEPIKIKELGDVVIPAKDLVDFVFTE